MQRLGLSLWLQDTCKKYPDFSLCYKSFKSFSEAAFQKKLEEIYSRGVDRQFYLSKELEKDFKQMRLPAIQIDIVNINDTLLPE